MTENTIYVPLIPRSHTIRLLVLHPGRWDDGIQAHLQASTLDDVRDTYTTISYTWGINTVKQLLINCNGKPVPVSENLFTILRRLRHPDGEARVWADALCINQADVTERTHQVGLMGEIYKNGRETVIWLGEQTAADDVGDRFLGNCISHDDWRVLRKGGPPKIARGSRSERILTGLERLTSRPWWSRIWVIQETVLSRKATVQFGMLSAPWSMFASAATFYAREQHSLCLDLSGTFRGHQILSRFSNAVLQIDNTRCDYQASTSSTTLLSLLWKFRPLEATDKRDKVLALLGLTTNWQNQPPLPPDYSIDAPKTFLRTALSSIKRSQSLTVLAGDLEAMLNRKRLADIPSWVIDWSLPCPSFEVERVASLDIYEASGDWTGSVRLHNHDHSLPILEVEGAFVDEIATVGGVSRHMQISDTCAVIREWNLLTRAAEQGLGIERYPTGGTYEDAFWKTLVGDLIRIDTGANGNGIAYRRATQDDHPAFRAWRMWSRCISRDTLSRTASFTQRDLDEGISSIHYALKTMTANRRFFITRMGYLGIGPRGAMVGDQVWVVKGSKVPFLVRGDRMKKCKSAELTTLIASGETQKGRSGRCGTNHECVKMVGDCFTFGVMDGEVFKRPNTETRSLFLV
ncbi:HET-domain-containing protein [Byssothecium circinans]|uniref:HET-domain-containing protein n=1 Tax=Byssothecium circinans TaxID=147558 RepID=A0A6A5UGL7_9PLEO|nr:HET-domain-containing protein [Byssothecium circinans]